MKRIAGFLLAAILILNLAASPTPIIRVVTSQPASAPTTQPQPFYLSASRPLLSGQVATTQNRPTARPNLTFPKDGNQGGPLRGFGPTGAVDNRFFGHDVDAQNICFVIDRSGSMLETFDYVKSELIRSINVLKPSQNFHVIFLSSGLPLENPPKKLVPATVVNKNQAADFFRDVVTGGQIDPLKGIQRAFQVTNDKGEKAQLIVLLTDGMLPDDCIALIKKLNSDNKVKIITIQFLIDK